MMCTVLYPAVAGCPGRSRTGDTGRRAPMVGPLGPGHHKDTQHHAADTGMGKWDMTYIDINASKMQS